MPDPPQAVNFGMMHPEQGVRRRDRHVTHRTIDPHVYEIMRPIRIRSFESEPSEISLCFDGHANLKIILKGQL